MKPTFLKIKVCASYLLDFLIAFYFLLVFSIIFFGGFSVVVAGSEVSATSAYKPVATLLVLFVAKLFAADFKKEIEKNKVLVSGTFLLIFFLCEFLARIYYSSYVPQDLNWASENMVMRRTPNPDRLYGIDTIKVSKNKSITYEYIAGVKGYLEKWPKGILLNINQMGFRDDEEKTHSKDKDKYRILGIGDSVMMGQGVKFEDTYGEVLENELDKQSKKDEMDIEFEFINLAVGGYNTTMEVETFFQKGLKFNPDMVIVSYVPNDFDLPNFIIKKENPWVSKKSFAVFYIGKHLKILANTKYGKFLGNIAWQNQKKDLGVWGLDMAMWRNVKYGNPIGNEYKFVPNEYKFMVGIEAYVREMKRLKKKCDELNLPLILQFDVPEEKVVENRERIVIQLAEELNIPVIKNHKEVRNFLEERNVGPKFFCVLSNDCHPNKWGHLIKGKKLASYIYDNYITSN
jgi:hypothetical protein